MNLRVEESRPSQTVGTAEPWDVYHAVVLLGEEHGGLDHHPDIPTSCLTSMI